MFGFVSKRGGHCSEERREGANRGTMLRIDYVLRRDVQATVGSRMPGAALISPFSSGSTISNPPKRRRIPFLLQGCRLPGNRINLRPVPVSS